ncbi:hypothetical protein C8R47DRAFT_973778 [Mycena vitilis]|nr:hypothetical protein C8R47DRAFT_973778 [Mycena vitilis]
MQSLDPAKRVLRSQLLPDSGLSLNRSPLKDARIAQRNYMHQQDPAPDAEDADTDDEILLSPGKNRQFNPQLNSNSKRSASPSPHDEYTDSAASQDGRELKRLKCDSGEAGERTRRDPEQAEGSDIENTDTNVRSTSSHTRNLSEPVVGFSRKASKPRSTSKQQTPASPKGKGRARSVPVFPVLDLSNPPTTPWSRRARSRSPSKDRDSPKLQITFSSLASIPDEAAMPPPSTSLPDAPGRPPMGPPAIVEPPSTPVASSYKTVFATPMSPLTPLPETPRPYQTRAHLGDGLPRTIGWGVDTAVSSHVRNVFPPPPQTILNSERPQKRANLPKGPRVASRAPLPLNPPWDRRPYPWPRRPAQRTRRKPVASSSSSTAPRKGPAAPSTSSSTSTVASSSKVAAKAALAAKEKGKGKAKEKPEEKPKEDKKVSVKAKMRPREKPKPLPLPIHVRLPEDSDGERTSTPTAASQVDDADSLVTVPVVAQPRLSSPLTEVDDGYPLMEDDGLHPPASSSPDMFLSPAAGPQLELSADVPGLTTQEGDVDMAGEGPTLWTDVVMDSTGEAADVSMSGAEVSGAKPPSDKKPKSRVGKTRPQLPAPADRVTRSTSLKRKEAEGGGASLTLFLLWLVSYVRVCCPAPTQKKTFSFGVGAAAPAGGYPAKKQKMNGDGASTSSQAGPPASPTKIPMPSPTKRTSFADPTKASAAKAAVTKAVAKNKPASAAAASGGSPSPTKNKLARASSLFTARPPRSYTRPNGVHFTDRPYIASFTRTFTGPGGNTSSLQTLASALEKLRMPPPERPNTSMGFSRDDTDSTLAESTRSADARSIGIGRPSGGLQRASTVASIESASSSTFSVAGESSKPSTSAAPLKSALVQRPLTAFMNPKGLNGASALAVGTGSIMRGGPSVFGAGRGRSAPKVSRNPGLPSVVASPVKGGGGGGDGDDTMLEEELMQGIEESGDAKDAPTTERVTSPRGKGKEKERLPEAWRQNASMRASMAGQDLSKSVSLPPKPIGLMGPPETPLDRVGQRSSSSSYPSSSSDSAGVDGMRRSTRIAKSTPETSIDDDDVAALEAQRPAATPIQPLTVLKGCIVFVDIISDIGDDSVRSFITDMLKNLGARVLGSVGQTCTHIVYKNGLRSTYNRYKALPDPKPHVVGMEWVVQSAEKRAHEDEAPYLIDMDDMNTTAAKRRKSMLPRMMSGGMDDDNMDGDHSFSFESSSSSFLLDDELSHLAPLERARLRKTGTQGI